MEDLGNINITIREAVGGRGGSGNVGGGPARPEPPIADQVAKAVQQGQQAQQQALNAGKQPPINPQAMFSRIDRIVGRQDVASELMNFLRRPSFAGATGLLREGTATRTMLQGLGKTGFAISGAFLALGAAAGAVTLALTTFKMAANHVASRIEETWRYSVQQAGAMAEQQVAKVSMLAREAAENGARYARVIRAQTALEQEKAKLGIEIGKLTAGLTEDFYKNLTRLMKEINGLFQDTKEAREKASDLLGLVPGVMLTRGIERYMTDVDESGLTMMQAIRLTLLRFVGMEETANELQNEYMDEIARNTRKDVMAEANEWFQADIQYLTGRRF